MSFFRPGDVVQVVADVAGNHPNFNRGLMPGDKILVDKVQRSRKADFAVSLGYLTEGGEFWIDGKCTRIAYKGDREHCVHFLEKFGRKPCKKSSGYVWAALRRNDQIEWPHFIPYHLHRHLKISNSYYRFTSEGITYMIYQSEEEAVIAASLAWMRMTAAQQQFFMAIHSLYEIFP